ncbi:hypothetical protein AAGG74_15910 [Bacillus mexicanus]|uniref:hypothetical protein n=1 Tax=Bacillus mexicanus TaxID=2834415 RepID=UPI003D1BBF18
MEIKKDELLEDLKLGSYLLLFNSIGDNYYFVNFNTTSELRRFIQKKGILNLYNEWLDFICSDYIAEEVEGYIIGKVISLEENRYKIEIIEEKGY